ncbi:MAG: folylpolyglutamate synthase/dihydrofolate synthase family protein [Bacteroidota bacterium]|nr:folylpolyglutamate synthase/dihydrofolate synthase family protein [Bacteroidota bacterium]
MYSQLPMYQRIGKAAYKANLDNTIALCNLLDNPQDHFKSIHIAGTNGKGSTAHFVASILQEYGLKTGLYTSPHLVDFRERIRINGTMIPESFVIQFIEDNKQGFNTIKPSFFEMTAGMAFDYFNKEQVDIAIIEAGMGGRLDSTNIINPLISAITNIGYDHMQFLGDTLESIAKEKAAIIKKGVPLVIGETQKELKDIFIRKAEAEGSKILFADGYFLFSNEVVSGESRSGMKLDIFKNSKLYLPELKCPLSGKYLAKNMITTLGIIDVFNASGQHVSTDHIRSGIQKVIENTELMGRWQVISQDPLSICDVGHNYDGLSQTMKQLNETPCHQLHFIMGTVNDKKLADILSLLPKDALYYFCKPDIPRGLDQEELAQQAKEAGLNGKTYASVKSAYEAASSVAQSPDVIFIGGSTFVVAEILASQDIIPH